MLPIALIFCCALTITLTSAQFYGNSYGTNYVDPYVTDIPPTFSNLNTYTTPYNNGYDQNQIQIWPYVIGQNAYPYYNYATYWNSYLSNLNNGYGYNGNNGNNGYNGYNGYNGNNGYNGYNAYPGYNYNNQGITYRPITTGRK